MHREQYCRFAREPESRKVGIDARITIDGTAYEVEPDMAGETVILLWGLFDDEMFVEFDGEKWGLIFLFPARYLCTAIGHSNAEKQRCGQTVSSHWLGN